MVDKRTMHEPSIRIPLAVRYPGLTTVAAKTVDRSGADPRHGAEPAGALRRRPAAPNIHGRSWVHARHARRRPGWRNSWFYDYNYEKQFPYTPNVRGVRTDDWKYIHYPHGDGGPDRHLAELYDLKRDPGGADQPDRRRRFSADGASS